MVTIYGDYLFLVLLIWNGYLLYITGKITKYHLSPKQILVISGMFAAGTQMLLLYPEYRILWGILMWGCFILIIRNFSLWIAFLGVTVFVDGLWNINPKFGIYIAITGLIFLFLTIQYNRKSNIYTVYCKKGDKTVKIKALYDTGNQLYIPDSDISVSLASFKALEPLVDWNHMEMVKSIPYQSVGEEHGRLLSFPIDSFVISEKNIVIKNPYIGITRQSLSSDDSYQMILHKDVFC